MGYGYGERWRLHFTQVGTFLDAAGTHTAKHLVVVIAGTPLQASTVHSSLGMFLVGLQFLLVSNRKRHTCIAARISRLDRTGLLYHKKGCQPNARQPSFINWHHRVSSRSTKKGSKEGRMKEACPVEENIYNAGEVLCDVRVRVGGSSSCAQTAFLLTRSRS
jgi:hypothetical protein